MQQGVRAVIQTHGMLARGELVIAAVSGGPDSVALLHVLHLLAPEWGARLHVFHMDHGLRGESSAADAAYVRGLSDQLGLPCTVVSLPPGHLKRLPGSLQARARAARYEALEQLAREIGATRVALGHHRDDQAETLLLRLLRGAGTRGLASMAPIRLERGITYIRPLLQTSRAEIEAYCMAHSLSPREDPTNRQPDYLRNRIRLDLLPKLAREYNPAIVRNLAQTASLLRDEDEFLDRLAAEALAQCQIPGGGLALSGDLLLREPRALSRRVIRLAARKVMGESFELGAESVARVLELIEKRAGTRVLTLPGGLHVTAAYGQCRFAPASETLYTCPSSSWSILPSGITDLPEIGLRVQTGGSTQPDASWEAAFDPDLLPGPLAIRFRLPGDRIWPVGMEGSKKLQDILVDAKVARQRRDRIPLLTAGDQVLWVIGFRLDRRYLATDATRRPLLVSVSELPDVPGSGGL